jgi:O-acetyl-ADP-ribose deacetylase (regulator of RNase III)
MIYFHTGDLLKTKYQYICHQVNCLGKMNSGIAKAIREKWPIVYEKYDEECNSWHAWADAHFDKEPVNRAAEAMLGMAQLVPISKTQTVINLFGQGSYGYDGRRYTSYDAFWMCLGRIKEIVPQGSSIAFPDHIGCCRGGANWNVILSMIDAVLGEDYEVHIYRLEENENDK